MDYFYVDISTELGESLITYVQAMDETATEYQARMAFRQWCAGMRGYADCLHLCLLGMMINGNLPMWVYEVRRIRRLRKKLNRDYSTLF